ncbi:MAG: 30S ribosomal protein S2 [Planctomycetota bacterium]
MDQVTVQELIDAGVHFGCRVSRWNPKMAPYIHGRRNLIHIIDLRETLRGVLRAQNLLYHLAAEGSTILWVGTKRQVKGVIQEAGQRTGMPVVTERWIGGTLTNFSVIRSRLKRLEELEKMEEDGSNSQLSKKMLSSMRRMRRKITRNLGGIREMTGMPGAMVVVDPAREANAVREARRMGVAVIGILDTDCDPASVDIVIPGNDDALKSVRLMIEQLVSSVEEGSANHRERVASMGSAEKRDEVFAPGDEPRPTRGQRLPEGMSTRLSPGSKASAVLDVGEAEEGSPAGSVAKYGDEESA